MPRTKFLRHIFKFHKLKESLKIAIGGIVYLFVYHRNMRIIFLTGMLALLLGLYLKLKGIELVILCITITLVFMAEIFNTAIEMIIDIHTDKKHVLIKLVKDIAAGVVLIACINALAVGYFLFARKIFKVTPAFAAVPTAAQIQRSQELLNKEQELKNKIEQGDSVFIDKILIKGVTLLTQDEVKDIIKPFQKKRSLKKDDIQQIIDAFTQAYYERGYFTQFKDISYTIKNKTLEIRVDD